MKVIKLSEYGPVISDENTGNEIFEKIIEGLQEQESVSIDLKEIKSMATFCAKQIFGMLYIKLGAAKFYDNVKMENVSEDLKTIIKIGIVNAIEEFKSESDS